jgi:gas vesicle protein
MDNENQVPEYHDNTLLGVVLGMLAGALAGAITMLLMAPQSGRDTRKQIQKKGIELRDRTTGMVEDTVAQVRSSADRLTLDGREKIQDLKHQGQDLAVEQLDRVSAAAQSGKKAIRGNHN